MKNQEEIKLRLRFGTAWATLLTPIASHKEVAEQMGISVSYAHHLEARAVFRLVTLLAELFDGNLPSVEFGHGNKISRAA